MPGFGISCSKFWSLIYKLIQKVVAYVSETSPGNWDKNSACRDQDWLSLWVGREWGIQSALNKC